MKSISLFSGIGGIEVGLARHGIHTDFFCEVDPLAQAILQRNFEGARIESDILALNKLPSSDIITAGFPCQDLSQAGAKKGISGAKSGLVGSLFSLVEAMPVKKRPEWMLIENVPYMLRLGRGHAMDYITSELTKLGYRWAYRVVDARCFGLPQRRARVVLLASRDSSPCDVLFGDNYEQPDLDGKPSNVDGADSFGFYWTEGSRGVGWAREGVPPIKCGSTLGIASPPAVWQPSHDFVGTVDIHDAERLQGFAEGWSDFSELNTKAKASYRWRLVGNAVSTKLSEWVGEHLMNPSSADFESYPLDRSKAWPDAAYGDANGSHGVKIGRWASNVEQKQLSAFLKYKLKPLSRRATEGFLSRAIKCTNVVYSESFLDSLKTHARNVE